MWLLLIAKRIPGVLHQVVEGKRLWLVFNPAFATNTAAAF